MAYNKTVWKNNEAPKINATNLNKMENGIANAVETDSIARVNNVVSRNLFNFYDMFNALFEQNGGTVSISDTSITYTSSVADGYITSVGKMNITAGKTYTLSLQTSQTSFDQRIYAYFYDSADNVQFQELGLANQNNAMTFTVPANIVSMRLRIGVYGEGNQTTFSQIQIEEGSIATGYAPYLNLEEVQENSLIFRERNEITDYNYLTSNGIYQCNFQNGTNAPNIYATGMLFVFRDYYISQLFIGNLNNVTKVYARSYTGSSWNAWVEIA